MLFPTQDKLNWSVRTESVQTESGIHIPKKKSIIRNDTNDYLSICSEDYYPYQNEELINLLEKVSGLTGLDIVKCGFFGKGEKVFIQMKSNDLKLGTDRIEGFMTGINSFDGSTSLSFGPSNVTISCMNTFYSSYKQLENKVRHTKNMIVRVDEICHDIESVLHEEQNIFDNIVKLSNTRFDDIIKDSVTKKLFNIKPEINLKDSESISSQTEHKMSKFYIDLHGEIQEKGDNLWGLFSGVTKYTTHSMYKGDNTERKMFGMTDRSVGGIERSIFKSLVELV
jgi:hypothetical protein